MFVFVFHFEERFFALQSQRISKNKRICFKYPKGELITFISLKKLSFWFGFILLSYFPTNQSFDSVSPAISQSTLRILHYFKNLFSFIIIFLLYFIMMTFLTWFQLGFTHYFCWFFLKNNKFILRLIRENLTIILNKILIIHWLVVFFFFFYLSVSFATFQLILEIKIRIALFWLEIF